LRINDLYGRSSGVTPTKTVAFTAAGRCFPVAYPATNGVRGNDVRYDGRAVLSVNCCSGYPEIAHWIERKVAARSRRGTKLEEVHRQIWRLHAGFRTVPTGRHTGARISV
jgi:hypothetical protein